MPEARDRLLRPNNEVAEMQSLRRTPVSIGILVDVDDNDRSIRRTPFRWGATPLTGGGSGQPVGEPHSTIGATAARGGAGGGRGLFGTPRTVYRRGGSRSQNTPPSGNSFRRGRGGRTGQQSVLPSWYPRTALGDITHVVQAIERRRVRLGDGEGRFFGSPTPIRIHHHHQPAAHDPSPSDAQLEHDISLVTPKPLASKTCKPSTLGGEETEFLTPQKKLLNSIDIVEKVVMEELQRLKRTPSAKKAEREKRVRTLMSMR
ncbi:hypothetical protein L6452_03752 [Arctium lappa]|uniref:Uncharacterized protein n=1 Tax=Arctium lappa TaxID=4217 RepID=A0ACB9FP32_ARCLA|nr:hypothetical protein L6452_03752 [Arctium lappa]